MIAAAKKSKVVLSTYHNRHWDNIILGAMEHLKKGEIGEICVSGPLLSGGYWNLPEVTAETTPAKGLFENSSTVVAIIGVITAMIAAGATIFSHIMKAKKE